MKVKDLKEWLDTLPPKTNLVISRCFLIGKKDKFTAIVDMPIIGMAHNPSDTELRFLLDDEHARKCFKKNELKLLNPPKRKKK